MNKITFQNIFLNFKRNSTDTVLKNSVFGKTILALLVFILSSNTVPDWYDLKNKSLEDWTWEVIKENEDVLFPFDSHWTKRAGLQALSHKGKFFIFGGRTPLPIPIPGASIIHGDVWSSSDKGKNWERILESNPPSVLPDGSLIPSDPNLTDHWANRAYFQVVKKGSYMYVLGGQDFNLITVPNEDYPDNCSTDPIFPGGPIPPCEPTIQVPSSQFFNDVWRSRDGVNWRRMKRNIQIDPEDSNPTHWAGRAGLSATVFKGYIYVMGGSVNDDSSIVEGAPERIYFNDVWRSRDGRRWQKVGNADWEPRAGGIAVVKGGYMYMVGGEEGFTCPFDPSLPPQNQPPCLDPPYFNDVWRTKDGVNWEPMTRDADWSKRPGHQVVVAQNQLVLFGGFGIGPDNGITPQNPSDVWVSKDGAKWDKVSDAPWNAEGSKDIKYDFDAVVEPGYGKYSDAIYTFGGDRETFNFDDPTNYQNVDNDVWKFSLPKKMEQESDVRELAVHPNYPNPFSESTTLKYFVPGNSYVSIMIFDRSGRFVRRLVSKTQKEGTHEVTWNGENYKGKPVRNGYYYARIWNRGKSKTIKMYKN